MRPTDQGDMPFDQLVSALWILVTVIGPCSLGMLCLALQVPTWGEGQYRVKKALLELQKREIIQLAEHEVYELRWAEQEDSFKGL